MNDLSKIQKVILMRGETELWIDKEKAEIIENRLISQSSHNFIKITELNITINSADIIGIFNPEQMEERTRRKNGEWKCKQSEWHTRNQKCECPVIVNGKEFIPGIGMV